MEEETGMNPMCKACGNHRKDTTVTVSGTITTIINSECAECEIC